MLISYSCRGSRCSQLSRWHQGLPPLCSLCYLCSPLAIVQSFDFTMVCCVNSSWGGGGRRAHKTIDNPAEKTFVPVFSLCSLLLLQRHLVLSGLDTFNQLILVHIYQQRQIDSTDNCCLFTLERKLHKSSQVHYSQIVWDIWLEHVRISGYGNEDI